MQDVDKDLKVILDQSSSAQSLSTLRKVLSRSRNNVTGLRSKAFYSIDSLTNELKIVANAGLKVEQSLNNLKRTNKNDKRIQFLTDLVVALDIERKALAKRLNQALSESNTITKTIDASISDLMDNRILKPENKTEPNQVSPKPVDINTPNNSNSNKPVLFSQDLNKDRETDRLTRENREQQIQFQQNSQRNIEKRLDTIISLLKSGHKVSSGTELPDINIGKNNTKKSNKRSKFRLNTSMVGNIAKGGLYAGMAASSLSALDLNDDGDESADYKPLPNTPSLPVSSSGLVTDNTRIDAKPETNIYITTDNLNLTGTVTGTGRINKDSGSNESESGVNSNNSGGGIYTGSGAGTRAILGTHGSGGNNLNSFTPAGSVKTDTNTNPLSDKFLEAPSEIAGLGVTGGGVENPYGFAGQGTGSFSTNSMGDTKQLPGNVTTSTFSSNAQVSPQNIGAGGQYRPEYKLSDADLSDEVVRTVAGEAIVSNPKSVDAVINTMLNRVGSKGYGPSANLGEVAASGQGTNGVQFAGYNKGRPNATQAEYIRSRIKALASGKEPDITNGANEFRAQSYSGPWAQKHALDGQVIGGNRFARNDNATGTYQTYKDGPKMPLGPTINETPTTEASSTGANSSNVATPNTGNTIIPNTTNSISNFESGATKDGKVFMSAGSIDKTKPVDIVVGYGGHRNNESYEDALNRQKSGDAVKGRNAIYIEPDLGDRSSAGKLAEAGGQDRLIAEAKQRAMKDYGLTEDNFKGGKTIATAYSGGGGALARALSSGAKVDGIQLNDALYGQQAQIYADYMKNNPNAKLESNSIPNTTTGINQQRLQTALADNPNASFSSYSGRHGNMLESSGLVPKFVQSMTQPGLAAPSPANNNAVMGAVNTGAIIGQDQVKNFWDSRNSRGARLYDNNGNSLVDPKLLHASAAGIQSFEAQNPNYRVETYGPGGGFRTSGSTSNHGAQDDGHGGATDTVIIDKTTGQMLTNHPGANHQRQGTVGENAPLYQQLFNETAKASSQLYPGSERNLRFGGYFSSSNPMDTMHTDTRGRVGMAGGNLLGGFTPEQMSRYGITKNYPYDPSKPLSVPNANTPIAPNTPIYDPSKTFGKPFSDPPVANTLGGYIKQNMNSEDIKQARAQPSPGDLEDQKSRANTLIDSLKYKGSGFKNYDTDNLINRNSNSVNRFSSDYQTGSAATVGSSEGSERLSAAPAPTSPKVSEDTSKSTEPKKEESTESPASAPEEQKMSSNQLPVRNNDMELVSVNDKDLSQ